MGMSTTRREFVAMLLGAPIKAIWVADADMHCYTANNVPAGEKAGAPAMIVAIGSLVDPNGPI